MKKFISVILFSVLISMSTLAFASKNNFQFQINKYYTQRQGGQTLDMTVRYAMKNDVSYSQYPDYRELRTMTLSYLEPTSDLPVNTFWEVIASRVGNDLMSHYPLSGVSVQIVVNPNESGNISEPGFHGPIYTKGDVIPLNQVISPVN